MPDPSDLEQRLQQLRVVEQDARKLEDDIARKRVIVSDDVRRIVSALVRFLN